MQNESQIKRYEPLFFLLLLGVFSISVVTGSTLYRFYSQMQEELISPPEVQAHWALGFLLMIAWTTSLWISRKLSSKQRYETSRMFLSASFAFALGVVFVQVFFLPRPIELHATEGTNSGLLYVTFMFYVYTIFVLLGVVAHGVAIAKNFKKVSYVDSFIFHVNPPNVLHSKMLMVYILSTTALWGVVLSFLYFYAA